MSIELMDCKSEKAMSIELMDSDQTCTDVLFGHEQEDFFNTVSIFKVTRDLE